MSQSPSAEHLFQQISAGDIMGVGTQMESTPELAESTNEYGISPVMWALYHQQTAIAEIVYQHVKQPDVFHCAAMGDLDKLRQHIEDNKTLITQCTPDGFTALHFSCFFQRVDCALFLIEAGADVNAVTQNENKLSPIHSAAAAQSFEIMEALLQFKADPDRQQQGGFTALMSAASHNNIELCELLIVHGATKKLTDDNGHTAWDHGNEKGFDIPLLK
ncbi:ankyrin repeat domain-containing protein [Pleionea sp. CnH1-48]|uniref:ankyrin repeat domain-containing protein n=1 Tax=Pleionea sp. CnH1-48 TaxID=2954494 RepID=UPI0020975685|nr:ankyrin repeat domain-containing protein [Pleionea sp. CnH1-48]MCO7223592.1 ankyrin repeat domain-containing protein [Pleionea sp. CnH1-48]